MHSQLVCLGQFVVSSVRVFVGRMDLLPIVAFCLSLLLPLACSTFAQHLDGLCVLHSFLARIGRYGVSSATFIWGVTASVKLAV